jgi:hypothetical protein
MIEYLCGIHKLAIHRLHRALRKAKLKSQASGNRSVQPPCFASLACWRHVMCHPYPGDVVQTEMGIHPDFQCNYADAVDCLGELPLKRTPLEKMQCLRDTHKRVIATAEANLVDMGKNIGMAATLREKWLVVASRPGVVSTADVVRLL